MKRVVFREPKRDLFLIRDANEPSGISFVEQRSEAHKFYDSDAEQLAKRFNARTEAV